MNRKLVANAIGCFGIACSLAYWVWLCIFAALPLNRREYWMKLDLGVSYIWPALWAAGLLLPLIAAAIGARRWVLAAIVPIVSCAAAIILLSHVHP